VGWHSKLKSRRPPKDGASWSARELKTLKALAKSGTRRLERSPRNSHRGRGAAKGDAQWHLVPSCQEIGAHEEKRGRLGVDRYSALQSPMAP
jgi:hypothetical protein